MTTINKPLVPKQCANPACSTGDAIYPSDGQFYRCADGFWYCCGDCMSQGKDLPVIAKEQAVTLAWRAVGTARGVLGL